MTHFQLYNVTAQFHGAGGRTHLSTQLRPVACGGGGGEDYPQSCWIEELGTYPEMVAVSALNGGGSSEFSMLDLQCLSYICHNYLGVGIVAPMADQIWPLGASVYPDLNSPDHTQLSHCSFLKHPHCYTPASLSAVQPVDIVTVCSTPHTPPTLQHAGSGFFLPPLGPSLNHCVSLFS